MGGSSPPAPLFCCLCLHAEIPVFSVLTCISCPVFGEGAVIAWYTNIVVWLKQFSRTSLCVCGWACTSLPLRLTPLDLALLAGHPTCSEYLIARGGKSAGGRVYRAVVTIQMAWRFYLYKVCSYSHRQECQNKMLTGTCTALWIINYHAHTVNDSLNTLVFLYFSLAGENCQ